MNLCSYLFFIAENLLVFVNGFDVFFLQMLSNFNSNMNDEANDEAQRCVHLKIGCITIDTKYFIKEQNYLKYIY